MNTTPAAPPTALLFAGQGAQHVGMGRDLHDHHPEIRALFEQSAPELPDDFLKVCFEGPAETLTDTAYCQPALFLHGLALFTALRQLRPAFSFTAAAGLSLGEFTAHTAAGHLTVADGARLVAARGRLMQEACLQSRGGMLALIGANEETAAAVAAAAGLEIANINSPGQIVLSGPSEHIAAAAEAAGKHGIKRALPLQVAGAYHSRLMRPAQEGLAPVMAQTPFLASPIPVYANIDGAPAPDPVRMRDTLLRQVTGSVRWQACIEAMWRDGVRRFIELGPGRILAGMCKRIHKEAVCLSAGSLTELEEIIRELD